MHCQIWLNILHLKIFWSRIWFAGVTPLLAKMEEPAGRGALPIVASVKQAGVDFTVMSQVFPVRWLPNREVQKGYCIS